jgi:hypothetical protein
MKHDLFLGRGMAVLLGLGISLEVQAAPVARLMQIEGSVLVNTGKDYLKAQTGMELSTGDRVLTLKDSSASMVYADHCTVQVSANSLFTLGKQDQCNQAAFERRGAGVIVPAEETGAVISATEAEVAVPAAAAGAGIIGDMSAATIAGAAAAAVAAAASSGGSNGGGQSVISPE